MQVASQTRTHIVASQTFMVSRQRFWVDVVVVVVVLVSCFLFFCLLFVSGTTILPARFNSALFVQSSRERST